MVSVRAATVLFSFALWSTTAMAADRAPPVIHHAALSAVTVGDTMIVEANIEDASPIFEPAVLMRFAGEADFERFAMVPVGGSTFRAEIPIAGRRGEGAYFIEAFDEQGNGPSRVGSPMAPLLFTFVEPPPPTPPVEPEPAPVETPVETPPVVDDAESEGLPVGLLIGAGAAAGVAVVVVGVGAVGALWYLQSQQTQESAVSIRVTAPVPTTAALGALP